MTQGHQPPTRTPDHVHQNTSKGWLDAAHAWAASFRRGSSFACHARTLRDRHDEETQQEDRHPHPRYVRPIPLVRQDSPVDNHLLVGRAHTGGRSTSTNNLREKNWTPPRDNLQKRNAAQKKKRSFRLGRRAKQPPPPIYVAGDSTRAKLQELKSLKQNARHRHQTPTSPVLSPRLDSGAQQTCVRASHACAQFFSFPTIRAIYVHIGSKF